MNHSSPQRLIYCPCGQVLAAELLSCAEEVVCPNCDRLLRIPRIEEELEPTVIEPSSGLPTEAPPVPLTMLSEDVAGLNSPAIQGIEEPTANSTLSAEASGSQTAGTSNAGAGTEEAQRGVTKEAADASVAPETTEETGRSRSLRERKRRQKTTHKPPTSSPPPNPIMGPLPVEHQAAPPKSQGAAGNDSKAGNPTSPATHSPTKSAPNAMGTETVAGICEFPIGTTIARRFRVEEHLGIGVTSDIYAVYDETRLQPVALKLLRRELRRVAPVRRQFLNNARDFSKLSHSGMVRIFDIYQVENLVFFTMERLAGVSLAQLMNATAVASRSFTIDDLHRLLIQIGSALHSVHRKELVYQEVAPSNIWCSENGQFQLMTFGLGRQIVLKGYVPHKALPFEILAREERFIAPELLKKGVSPTPASDQYALAFLISELSKLPDPDSGKEIKQGFSKELQHAVEKAMSPDPSKRFPSIEDFVQEASKIETRPNSKPEPVLSSKPGPLLDISPVTSATDGTNRDIVPVQLVGVQPSELRERYVPKPKSFSFAIAFLAITCCLLACAVIALLVFR